MPPVPPPPARRRSHRCLSVSIAVGLTLLLILAAGLPGLIGTRFVRDKILGSINQRLAPGRLEVDRFAVSWTRPTRLVGFKLIAPDGARVAQAPVAEISRSLAQILFRSEGATVLTLNHATVAIRRHSDGKLDLVEALRSVIDQPDPKRDLTIQIKEGSLQFRSDGLAEPIVAQSANLDLRIPPAPQGVNWELKLGHERGGEFVARGDTNRWTAPNNDPGLADLRLDLEAKHWPIETRSRGLRTSGQLDGSAGLIRRGGRWDLEGNARIDGLKLSGDRLAGDTFDPGPVTALWSLGQDPSGWTIRRFSVDSTVGSVRAEGGFDPGFGFDSTQGPPQRVEARVDLAAIVGQLPHLLPLRPGFDVEKGSARLVAERQGRSPWKFEATVADLVARNGERRFDLREPASLSARVFRTDQSVSIENLLLQTSFLNLSGSGQVDDPTGIRAFSFHGKIAPNFEAMTSWMREHTEPSAKLVGKPRSFQVAGNLSGSDPPASVVGEVGLNLLGLDVYGIKLGATPIVIRAKDGQILIDPISTTLNEGQIQLEPGVISHNSKGDPVLRLGKNSTIRDAQINDDVSRRVLAFVAPVLEGATRASGRVSVDLDHAEFPLTSGHARSTLVEGLVVFNDVTFAPGPLANDLLGVIGRRDASLKLDRPVTLTIADGRVNQSGLALPIGDLTRIEFAGWVDFDRNLALTATLPVTPAMLGNNPFLADVASGAQVRLPIGGTLNKPTIDRDAFAANLRDLGKSLLTRGAMRGVLELLNRANRPKDPNAAPSPPPPTPAERKALRQERRAERKARRDTPPEVAPNP